MSKKILLADDSVTIRKVVELTFMEEDYDLTSVSDGREALDHLGESVPDLVIADVHMGDVSGFDVCREAKAKWPDIPVLLLVGTFEAFDPADVTKCGADDFLKKPFDSQDLLGQVARLLGQGTDSSDGVTEAQPVHPEASTPEDAQTEEIEEEPEEVRETSEFEVAEEAEPESESEVAEEPAPERPQSEVLGDGLSEEDVDRIARRVVELLSDETVREVAWEVVPDMAEVVIKDRLRELESQVE